MRVLVDIVHPADVLFFRRPVAILLDGGHDVTIASREKDVTRTLLDSFGLSHTAISTQGSGALGLAAELVRRDLRLLRLARKFRPDVMLGFGGIAISHVGRLLRIPSVAFYDSENARLQTRLTWPFIDALYVPEDYDGPVPKGRTTRVPGTKDLSYFHPSAFRPDRAIACAEGLDPDRRNVFLRMVRWGANHDLGKGGWTERDAESLVTTLSPLAKLHVSAEDVATLPAVLRPYLWTGDPKQVHHLLGHCDAYVGESATMACEAVTLGVPSIYAGVDFPGYTRGLSRRGLLDLVEPAERPGIAGRASALLDGADQFAAAHRDWLSGCPDWAQVVVDAAMRAARKTGIPKT